MKVLVRLTKNPVFGFVTQNSSSVKDQVPKLGIVGTGFN